MLWFYRLPLAASFALTLGAFVGGTLAGLRLLAPFRARLARRFAEGFSQVSYFGTQVWLTYSLILQRILSQAKLKKELRTDESGKPFLWITTIKSETGGARK